MKIYLLVDDTATGKTTLLKQLGYTFCSEDCGMFSFLNELIANGEKKIAIDDYRDKGSAKTTLKHLYYNEIIVCERKHKGPVYILPDWYQDLEIVLATHPEYIREIDSLLLPMCQKVSVEEFKEIKGVE